MLTTKVLLLGLDATGKTSLLYKLKLNEIVQTIPTIGFNVEEIKYKDRKIVMWDLGGGANIKHLWKHYFQNINCIIFLVDISRKDRLDEFIESFQFLLDIHKDYRNVPILFFCNKFNNKEEFELEEMLSKINMPPEISPNILKGNVLTGEGLQELLEYIYNNITFEEEKEENENKEKEDKGENENEEKEKEEEKENNKKDKLKVIMLGLNGSGKTKILYLLKLGKKSLTIPTIGFNVETIENNTWEKNIVIWDVGGHKKIRCLWIHYLKDINGLIWVYDINDKDVIEESQKELIKILTDSQVKENMPLLIYANKTDLNINDNKPEDFMEGIQDYINNRPYFIQQCNENDIESYKNGLSWLYNNINI